jgi:glycerol 2-dehydrogenase (NADP+)
VHAAPSLFTLNLQMLNQWTKYGYCSPLNWVTPEIVQKNLYLNTGARMPAIGLVTWQSEPDAVRIAAKDALQAGYRHIDTSVSTSSCPVLCLTNHRAQAYGTDHEVGQGIKDSGVPREEIWVTTKLDNSWHKRGQEGIDTSLKWLGLDYVDLHLMHWQSSTDPNDLSKHLPDWDFRNTW